MDKKKMTESNTGIALSNLKTLDAMTSPKQNESSAIKVTISA